MSWLAPLLAAAGESPAPRWRRALTAPLRLDERDASVERHGFPCESPAMRARIEAMATAFLAAYNAALEEPDVAALAERLDRLPPEIRGFAHEGVGTALAVLDALPPWRRRLEAYLAGPGAHQLYIVTIGAGWVLGRLPLAPWRLRRRLDPLTGWLAIDGHGFQQGFLRWQQSIERQVVPRRLRGYERRAFDQGLGRSLWFVRGAEPRRIADTIAGFPAARRADLWAGVGLAAAYAGDRDEASLRELVGLAAYFRPMLAQGAAFAAAARDRGRNPAAHTDLACRVICGRSSAELAALCNDTSRDLPPDPPDRPDRPDSAEPAFEIWRQRIQTALA